MPFSEPRRPLLTDRAILSEMDVYRSSAFMEALVAAYAIVAHSDGEVAARERRRLLSMARNEPLLAHFSHADVVGEFAIHEANYELDNEVASVLAVEKLQALSGRPREAGTIVAAARAAATADGILHPAELRALAKVMRALGVSQD
mgnify:FL=1